RLRLLRLSLSLLSLFFTLDLNPAALLHLRRFHSDFQDAVLECGCRRVGLHTFWEGNFTVKVSIAPLDPVNSFLVFLVLVCAFAFYNKCVVRNLNGYMVQIDAGKVGSQYELSVLFENVDLGRKSFELLQAKTSEARESNSLEHSIHVLSYPSYHAKRIEHRHPFRSCKLTQTSWLNGPRLLLLSARH